MKNISKLAIAIVLMISMFTPRDVRSESAPVSRVGMNILCGTVLITIGGIFAFDFANSNRHQEQANLKARHDRDTTEVELMQQLAASGQSYQTNLNQFKSLIENNSKLKDSSQWTADDFQSWTRLASAYVSLSKDLSNAESVPVLEPIAPSRLNLALAATKIRTVLDIDAAWYSNWATLANAAENNLEATKRDAFIRSLIQFKDNFDENIKGLEATINQIAEKDGETDLVKEKRAALEKMKLEREGIQKDIDDLMKP